MVSLYRIVNVLNDCAEMEIKGKSTDTKPDELGGFKVSANSMFFEMDTGDFYYLESPFQKGNETEEIVIEEQSFTGTLDEVDGTYYWANLEGDMYSNKKIKAIFDGVEYVLEQAWNDEDYAWGYGAQWDDDLNSYDFSTYPFGLECSTEAGNHPHIVIADGEEHTIEVYGISGDHDIPAVWKKFGSGGGEPEPTGEKLFDGEVTTVKENPSDSFAEYEFNPAVVLNYSSLIVEFDGTRYTVSNISEFDGAFEFGAPYVDVPDFSEYPFNLWYGTADVLETIIITEEAGTYSLKIWANSDPVTDDDVMPSPDDPQ